MFHYSLLHAPPATPRILLPPLRPTVATRPYADRWPTPRRTASSPTMGFLDAALGNATVADRAEVDALINPILIPDEIVTHAFKVGVRDLILFSTRRFIIVDKQGMTGKKLSIISHPYRTVLAWAMTTSGTIDLDGELTLTLGGAALPLVVSFGKKTDLKVRPLRLHAATTRLPACRRTTYVPSPRRPMHGRCSRLSRR